MAEYFYSNIGGTGKNIDGPNSVDGHTIYVDVDVLYNVYRQCYKRVSYSPAKYDYIGTKADSEPLSDNFAQANKPNTPDNGNFTYKFNLSLIPSSIDRDSRRRITCAYLTYFVYLYDKDSLNHYYGIPIVTSAAGRALTDVTIAPMPSKDTDATALDKRFSSVTLSYDGSHVKMADTNGSLLRDGDWDLLLLYKANVGKVLKSTTFVGGGSKSPLALPDSYSERVWFGFGSSSRYEVRYAGIAILGANQSSKDFKVTYISTAELHQPDKPTIDDISANATTGIVTAKLTLPSGKQNANKRYAIVSISKDNPTVKSVTTQYGNTATVTIDVPDIQSLTGEDRRTVTVEAYQYGLAGVSTTARRKLSIARPKVPAIKSVNYSDKTSGTAVFGIDPYSSENYPVDGVRIQALVSTTYERENQIPATARWENVGNQDNGNSVAISVPVSELIPDPGRYTWVRLKTWMADESVLYSLSSPLRLTGIETPILAPSTVYVYSMSAKDSGDGLVVTVVWNSDDAEATEVSWSTDREAWESTSQPDTFDMIDGKWDAGPLDTYDHHLTIVISGIDPNTEYWVRAVRHKTVSGEEVYGEYSTPRSMSTSGDITYISLFSPAGITESDGLTYTWEHDGLVSYDWVLDIGADKESLNPRASGKGGMGVTVDVARWTDMFMEDGAFAGYGKTIYAQLRIVHPNGVYRSNIAETVVVTKPSCFATCTSELHAKPCVLTVQSSDNSATLTAMMKSLGGNGGRLVGDAQADGDVVWALTTTPSWELSSDYSSDENLQAAKLALDAAQRALDAKIAQLDSAKSLADSLAGTVDTLTSQLQLSQTRIAELEEQTDVEDPDQTLVDELAEERQRAETIQGNLEQAESDLEAAREDVEEIDTTDEEASLKSAVEAYASAEAVYLDEHDIKLPYVTHLEVGEGTEILDLTSYEFTVSVSERTIGLTSDPSTCITEVNWLHKAVVPENMEVSSEVADTGPSRNLTGVIEIGKDAGTFDTDRYNVYRYTQDGPMLVYSGANVGDRIVDQFAPFGIGRMYYIVEAVTSEGSCAWKKFEYYLLSGQPTDDRILRIDWNGNSLEMNHCIEAASSYEKDVEVRRHLDGSVSAYWNSGTMRSDSLSAAIIRGAEAEDLERLRELAQYEGTCMVRMSDGVAYEGTIAVNSVNATNGSAGIKVSLTTQQVDQTGTFMAAVTEEE